jgi:hypothetical protein
VKQKRSPLWSVLASLTGMGMGVMGAARIESFDLLQITTIAAATILPALLYELLFLRRRLDAAETLLGLDTSDGSRVDQQES